ncbi:MAG: 3-phosphoshikimate 1-carboxyvinyltransferase 1 [Firmicutes bacterium]|nr:3-phosphoshikimate 1-carboxyvinyltransferase 1 [candidate division NPL-UPA2 bacterium]
MEIEKIKAFREKIRVPGDKSISHRALLVAAQAPGLSCLCGLSDSEDVKATRQCLRQVGIAIEDEAGTTCVLGKGLPHWHEPEAALSCENSGTTMRLLAGLLAGSAMRATLVGDASLSNRPMQRIVGPLTLMGGQIQAMTDKGRPPLMVTGGKLKGCDHRLPIASAQVKSALLLAGLSATGVTRVWEKHPTRDHTERMLRAFGCNIDFSPGYAELQGGQTLRPFHFQTPGDISGAAFFLVLAAVTPGAELVVENVGLNPTRTGVLDVLRAMGASLTCTVHRTEPEPVGSIHVSGGHLRGFRVGGADIPRLIDELPILAVAAALATGRTEVRDAAELRVKESDRITALLTELRQMGARCQELPDGFTIEGGRLSGALVNSHGDHRLAMSLAVAGCSAEGITLLRGAECVAVSYRGFFTTLESLVKAGEARYA